MQICCIASQCIADSMVSLGSSRTSCRERIAWRSGGGPFRSESKERGKKDRRKHRMQLQLCAPDMSCGGRACSRLQCADLGHVTQRVPAACSGPCAAEKQRSHQAAAPCRHPCDTAHVGGPNYQGTFRLARQQNDIKTSLPASLCSTVYLFQTATRIRSG